MRALRGLLVALVAVAALAAVAMLALLTLDLGARAPLRGSIDLSVGEVVTPYLMINGTLGRPGVAVDPKGALFTGGAAVATAGISILARSAWDRVFQAGDPCAAATVEADKLARGRAEPQKKSLLQKLRGR